MGEPPHHSRSSKHAESSNMMSWEMKHNLALLAWLDFCKETAQDFHSTVARHIAEETGKTFSKEQVDSHLYYLWHGKKKRRFGSRKDLSSGEPPSSLMTAILIGGSAYISELSQTFREDIEATLREYRSKMPQSASDGYSNRQIEAPPASDTEGRREINLILSNLHKNTRQFAQYNNPTDRTTADIRSENETTNTTMRTKSNAERVVAKNKPHRLFTTPETGSVIGRRHTDESRSGDDIESRIIALEARHQLEIQKKDMEFKVLQDQWWRELEEVCQREQKLKRNEKALLAKIKHLTQNLAEQLTSGRDPEEFLGYLQNQQIWTKTKENHDLRKVANFAKLTGENLAQIETGKIDLAMGQIKLELDAATPDHVRQPLFIPRISNNANADLWSLVQSLVPASHHSTSAEAYLSRWISKFDKNLIIRTLALAAVREWVFMSNFPDFNPSDTRLLGSVWEIIHTNNGWRNLRNVSLASHHLLIEDSSFQSIMIPHKANQLADRLSRALASLSMDSQTEATAGLPQTWSQSQLLYQKGIAQFNKLFEHALKLKCATVTTDQAFEFVVFAPGMGSERATVISPTGHVSIERTNARIQPSATGFWKLASIYIYNNQASSPRDRIADALVQNKNFVVRDEIFRAEQSSFVSTINSEKLDHDLLAKDGPEYGIEPYLNRQHIELSSLESLIGSERTSTTNPTFDPHGTPVPARRSRLRRNCDNGDAERDDSTQSLPNREGQVSTNGGWTGTPGGQAAPGLSEARFPAVRETILEAPDPIEYKCKDCGRVFPSWTNLSRHKTNKSCTICLTCGKDFHKSSTLLQHRMTEHATNYEILPQSTEQEVIPASSETGIQCNTCRKQFTLSSTLAKHIKNKACSRCEVCQKLFLRRMDMKNHMLRDHAEKAIEPQVANKVSTGVSTKKLTSLESCPRCLICDRVFANMIALRNHNRSCRSPNGATQLRNLRDFNTEEQGSPATTNLSKGLNLTTSSPPGTEAMAPSGKKVENMASIGRARNTGREAASPKVSLSDVDTVRALSQSKDDQHPASSFSIAHSSPGRFQQPPNVDMGSEHVEHDKGVVRKAAGPPLMDIAERVKKRQRRHKSQETSSTTNGLRGSSTDSARTLDQAARAVLLNDEHLHSRASAGEDTLATGNAIGSFEFEVVIPR